MSLRVILGISGASGAALALDCARHLARMGVTIDLVTTRMARHTCDLELGTVATNELEWLADVIHDGQNMGPRLPRAAIRSRA